MINVHGIRRNVKNVVRNYTDAQVKVREATSNDPWGPSSTLMSEIADLTYNVVAFSEIMQMVWKRLNDHGKNWRHVYKALVLLEYLIKTGSEKVAQQCKENIFAIQTLKDFQYTEDNKDQGMNVREKSKQLVSLLKDDERLRNERTRALKAKERFAQAAAHVANDTYGKESSGHMELGDSDLAISPRELECARPQTAGEEELQLQLALAMSKEEAEMEDRMRKNDDLRLQMAITESQEDFKRTAHDSPTETASAMNDLMAISMALPSSKSSVDPWGLPIGTEPNLNQTKDPWDSAVKKPPSEPWDNDIHSPPAPKDPWEPPPLDKVKTDPWNSRRTPTASPLDELGAAAANGETDDFDILSKRSAQTSPGDNKRVSPDSRMSPNPFNMAGLTDTLNDNNLPGHSSPSRRTPETFLGANSNLVNLDCLVNSKNTAPAGATNPFATVTTYNPFQAAKPPPPSINQLRAQNQFTVTQPNTLQGNMNNTLPEPLIPTGGIGTASPVPAAGNPFV